MPDGSITFMKLLVVNPIEYHSCFISYSSKDEEFAKQLYADLQATHVRCWIAVVNLKIGERFRPKIDEAIRLSGKLFLVLSKNSLRKYKVGACGLRVAGGRGVEPGAGPHRPARPNTEILTICSIYLNIAPHASLAEVSVPTWLTPNQ